MYKYIDVDAEKITHEINLQIVGQKSYKLGNESFQSI